MSNIQVSFYKSATDNVGTTVEIFQILNAIKEGKWKKKIEDLRVLYEVNPDEYANKKKDLNGATFAGVFTPKRNLESYTTASGFVSIDIDCIDKIVAERLKDQMIGDPKIFCAFLSPSGYGVKVLCRAQDTFKHYDPAFLTAKQYIEGKYGIPVDAKVKDHSRLCFVSWDPTMYLNYEAEVFIPDHNIKDHEEKKKGGREGFERWEDTDSVFYMYHVCKQKFVEPHFKFVEGERNSYIHNLACTLNRAGMAVMDACNLIMQDYSDQMSHFEIKSTIKKAYQNNRHEHGKVNIKNLGDQEDILPGEVLGEDFEEAAMDAFINIRDAKYIITGCPSVDRFLKGGLRLGNAYGFTGTEGTYKSILAINTAVDNALNNITATLYLNGEMSKTQLVCRIISKVLRIELEDEIKQGHISQDEFMALFKKANEKMHNNLILHTGQDFTPKSIQATVEFHKKKGKQVGLIIVDGLSQMAAPTARSQEIDAAIKNSERLKSIAKDNNSAVVALIHTTTGVSKTDRNPYNYVRGGVKVRANLDAYFGFSLYDIPGEEGTYKPGLLYLRMVDKREQGAYHNVAIQVERPLKIRELTGLDPETFAPLKDGMTESVIFEPKHQVHAPIEEEDPF